MYPAQQGYKTQGIYYLNKRTHRLQQHVGGVSPLLALCNTLFLNHRIYAKSGRRTIKGKDLVYCLMQHLQNMLLDSEVYGELVKTEVIKSDGFIPHSVTNESEGKKQQDQNKNNNHTNIEHTLITKEMKMFDEFAPLFSKLEQSLDINIKFSDIHDFEQNPAYQLFNHFGITLYHAFVIDPKQERLYNLISNKSYKEATDFLISYPKKDATEQQRKQLEDEKDIIRKFLAEFSHQVTPYGLERLRAVMNEQLQHKICILFRDNHFSTIIMHGELLFEFVTDEGIIDMDPQITWQTFFWNFVDPVFLNNKFREIMSRSVKRAKLAKPLACLKSWKYHYMSERHMYKTPYVVGLLVDRYIRMFEHDTMNCIMIPDGINQMLYTYLLYEYYKLLDAKIWISLLMGKCIKFTEPLLKQLIYRDKEILFKLINKIKGVTSMNIERRNWLTFELIIKALETMKIDAPCGMQDVFCNLYGTVQIIHNLSHKAKEIGFEGPFIDSEIIYELRHSYGLCVMTKTTKSLYELM
eukprot:514769_1